MNSRELMEFASGKSNFRILRILHDTPMYSGDISSRIQCHIKTARTLLHRLKENNFVEYQKMGRKHIYHIKTPFETPMHETIMGFVSMAPPIKKQSESDKKPLEINTTNPQLITAQREYWTTLIKGFFTTLLHQGSVAHQRKIESKLQEIKKRIEQYK